MSYSFVISGASKAEALAKVATEFDKVVASQPIHAADKDAAVAAATAFINMLEEPTPGEEIAVNMYGSLGWREANGSPGFRSGNVSVSTSVNQKKS